MPQITPLSTTHLLWMGLKINFCLLKKELWFYFILLFEVYFLVCAFHKDVLFFLNVILAITYISYRHFGKYTENILGNVLECTGFIYLFIIHCLLIYLFLLSIFFEWKDYHMEYHWKYFKQNQFVSYWNNLYS